MADHKTYTSYYNNAVIPERIAVERRKQAVMPVLDNIMNYIKTKDSRFCNTAETCGPFYQGNFLWKKTSDEFIYHVHLSGLGKWSWGTSQPRYYNFDYLLQWLDIDNIESRIVKVGNALPNPPPGHSFCEYGSHMQGRMTGMTFENDIIPHLVRKRFKELLTDAVRTLPGYRGDIKIARKKAGPVLSLRIPCGAEQEIIVHMVPLIPMAIYFPDHIDWPRHGVKWPSEDKINRIKAIGIHCAATTSFYWSNSFDECAKELMVDIDEAGGCRKKVYHILETLTGRFHEAEGRIVSLLNSQHIKSLFLWECENKPYDEDWEESKLPERVNNLLNSMKEQLHTRKMPLYWDSRVNLLDSLYIVDKGAVECVLANVEKYFKNPNIFLQ